MKRREFVAGIASAGFWPLSARAQSRVPVVGILVTGNRDPAQLLAVFKDELQRLGYLEGQNIRST